MYCDCSKQQQHTVDPFRQQPPYGTGQPLPEEKDKSGSSSRKREAALGRYANHTFRAVASFALGDIMFCQAATYALPNKETHHRLTATARSPVYPIKKKSFVHDTTIKQKHKQKNS